MIFPIIPVPLVIRGRILRRFRKHSAIGQDNSKTLAELEMEEFPFTSFGAKRIFQRLQRQGIILNDEDKYYLLK